MEMLESDPDDVFLQYAVAMACRSEGDAPEALNRFGQVIEGHPDYVPAYFQKGQLLAETGETEAARQILTDGIAAAVKTGDSHAEGEMTEFLDSL